MGFPAAINDWRNRASCWLRPEVANMVGLDGEGLTTFDQCMTGHAAMRPTTSFTMQVPEFRRTVIVLPDKGRSNHSSEQNRSSTGQSNRGSGQKCSEKTHAAEMCRLLACAIKDATYRRWMQPRDRQDWDLESDRMSLYVPLDPCYYM
eukprot:7224507-Pyramimonas_sp.AAC.1